MSHLRKGAVLGWVAASVSSASVNAQPEVRVLADLRPGPVVPGPSYAGRAAGGRYFLSTVAGRISVDLETGASEWMPIVPNAARNVNGTYWFTSEDELWRATGAMSEAERVAVLPAAGLDVFELANDLFVEVDRNDAYRFARVVDGELVPAPLAADASFVGRTAEGIFFVQGENLVRWRPGERTTVATVPMSNDGSRDVVSVHEVGGQLVVVAVDGPYRLDRGGLSPLLPEPVAGADDPTSRFRIRAVSGVDILWIRFASNEVATDGTRTGTFSYEAPENSLRIPLGRARLLYRPGGPTPRGMRVFDATGRVVMDRSDVLPEDVVAFDDGSFLALSFDGPNGDGPGELLRIDPDATTVDAVTEVAAGARLFSLGQETAVLAHQPPESELVLLRFDSSGRAVPGPNGFEQRIDATRFEAQARSPRAAVGSGAVVLTNVGASEPALAIVDAAAGGIALEPTAGRYCCTDGEAVFFVRQDDPFGALTVFRWTRPQGVREIVEAEAGTRWAPGYAGRPLLHQPPASIDGNELELRNIRQVDDSGLAVPIFGDIEGSLDVVARDDGVWLLHASDDDWTVSRWDFERSRSEAVWTGSEIPPVEQTPPYPFALRDLWVVGDTATPWLVQRASSDTGLWRLDENVTDEPATVLWTPRGGLLAEPRSRPIGFGYDGRLHRFRIDAVERIEDLEGYAALTPMPWGFFASSYSPERAESELVRVLSDGPPRAETVRDIWPGPLGSHPLGATRLPASAGGAEIAFTADAPGSGRELWVSDGTAAGTRQACEFQPGGTPGVPASNIAVGPDALYVAAFVEGVGTEVVEVPMAAIRGDVPCVLNGATAPSTPLPEGRGGEGLGAAEAGCGCSSVGRDSDDRGVFGAALVLLAACAAFAGIRRRNAPCRSLSPTPARR